MRRSVVERLEAWGWRAAGGLPDGLCWQARPLGTGVLAGLPPGVFSNHMPGFPALTAKHRLAETISVARARVRDSSAAEALRCFPETFILPRDAPRLQRAARRRPDALWIRKPVASARGIGIELVEDLGRLETGDGWLVQEYLTRPHLLDGHKYTLRLYVLLTSVDPLLVYLFGEGFCKRGRWCRAWDHGDCISWMIDGSRRILFGSDEAR